MKPLPGQKKLFNDGRCNRCNRRLRNKASIKRGYGSSCWRKEKKTAEAG